MLFENLEALDITRVSDFFDLFPLVAERLNLTHFVYKMYRVVFAVF